MEKFDGRGTNLTLWLDIARKEKVGTSYVSKVFNLNFLSPKIVRAVLTGTQPRALKLQILLLIENCQIWQEQEEILGF